MTGQGHAEFGADQDESWVAEYYAEAVDASWVAEYYAEAVDASWVAEYYARADG